MFRAILCSELNVVTISRHAVIVLFEAMMLRSDQLEGSTGESGPMRGPDTRGFCGDQTEPSKGAGR